MSQTEITKCEKMDRETFYQYILDNFTLSGGEQRMVDTILQFLTLLRNFLMKKNVRFHGSRVMGTVKQRGRSYSKDFVSFYNRRMVDERKQKCFLFYYRILAENLGQF